MITEAVIPAGLTKEIFAQAIEEYKGVVGAENVYVDLEQLAPYFKTMQPVDDKLHQASGAIAARSVEEIQGVLKICNKYKIPVWPISTGRNFGYGSAGPATPGQMILDLRRMNRILEVNADLCTVLVEPGVTYQDLHDYFEDNDIPLMVSHPAPGPIVGPVGNALDRGVGYNRQGENCASICGLEVVLANGDVVRTGMGGVKGTDTWQGYKWGFGPNPEALFVQSNFGVVTKMGFWLQPKPETYKMLMVAINGDENLEKAIDIQRKLRLQMVIELGALGTAPLQIPATIMPRSAVFQGEGRVPPELEEKIKEQFKIPDYTFMSNIYGTKEQVELNYAIVQKAFEGVGFVMTTENNVPHDSPFWHWENMTTSKMDMHEFHWYNWVGGGGSVWFSPVVPAVGAEVSKSIKMNRKIIHDHGFDYFGGVLFQPRSGEHVMELVFDKNDPEETQRAYNCYKALLEANAAIGRAPYRVCTAFHKLAAEVYGPENIKLNARFKKMLDPNNILAPGKSGIG